MTPDLVKFDEQGLIPAIAQDRLTGEVRMLAWMNAEALRETERTGLATFYSRSRGRLWVKGESSGHQLRVLRIVADCDADTLLLLCDPEGPSCHTGRDNCFFEEIANVGQSAQSAAAANTTVEARSAVPELLELERTIRERQESTGEKSYTKHLLEGGPARINAKINEEAGELARAIEAESEERVASEAADVLYHVLVGLRSRGVSLRQVLQVLAERSGRSGHEEKAARQ